MANTQIPRSDTGNDTKSTASRQKDANKGYTSSSEEKRNNLLRGIIKLYEDKAKSNLYGTKAGDKRIRDETITLVKDAEDAVAIKIKNLGADEKKTLADLREKRMNLQDAINLYGADYKKNHSFGHFVKGIVQKSDSAKWALLE